jgi:hypothetical protein
MAYVESRDDASPGLKDENGANLLGSDAEGLMAAAWDRKEGL